MRKPRHLASPIAEIFVALALLATPLVAQPQGDGVDLGFFVQTYADLDSGLVPIEQGPLTFVVAAPQHRLQIHRVTVWLDPRDSVGGEQQPGTLVRIDAEVDFEGEGDLEVTVSGPGIAQQLSDSVVAQRQTVRAHSLVRAESHPEGYIFTVVEPGPSVALAIESALLQQLVGLCKTLSVLPVMNLDCDALGKALAVIRVPQPEPGAQFFLPYEYLGEVERRYFAERLGE